MGKFIKGVAISITILICFTSCVTDNEDIRPELTKISLDKNGLPITDENVTLPTAVDENWGQVTTSPNDSAVNSYVTPSTGLHEPGSIWVDEFGNLQQEPWPEVTEPPEVTTATSTELVVTLPANVNNALNTLISWTGNELLDYFGNSDGRSYYNDQEDERYLDYGQLIRKGTKDFDGTPTYTFKLNTDTYEYWYTDDTISAAYMINNINYYSVSKPYNVLALPTKQASVDEALGEHRTDKYEELIGALLFKYGAPMHVDYYTAIWVTEGKNIYVGVDLSNQGWYTIERN